MSNVKKKKNEELYGQYATENTEKDSASNMYGDYLSKSAPAVVTETQTVSYGDGGVKTEDVVTESKPMSYEEYIAEQKRIAESTRQESLKEAEAYKQRAMADAQAGYAQNMATYGTNAEMLSNMGLTGGGYSDYLNAQAYAQKRSDMQTANANASAMKQQAGTNYANAMSAINKEDIAYQEAQRANKQTGYNTLLSNALDANSGLTEEAIRAMGTNLGLSNEEVQYIVDTMNKTQETQQSEYSTDSYNALIADVQNPTLAGNYTEKGIRKLGEQWGWSEEQIQEAVDVWNNTNGVEPEIDLSSNSIVSAIKRGDYDDYARDELESLLRHAVVDKKIELQDINTILSNFDARRIENIASNAYVSKALTEDEYKKFLDGDEEVVKKLNLIDKHAKKYLSGDADKYKKFLAGDEKVVKEVFARARVGDLFRILPLF